MDILNEIFLNWTDIITPDLIKIFLALILISILVMIFIDSFF